MRRQPNSRDLFLAPKPATKYISKSPDMIFIVVIFSTMSHDETSETCFFASNMDVLLGSRRTAAIEPAMSHAARGLAYQQR